MLINVENFKRAIDNQDTLGAILLLESLELNRRYKNLHGNTPLTYASFLGNIGVVVACISKGVNVDELSVNDWTALHAAADHGHTEIIQALVGAGANVNIRSDDDYLPLHCAAISGYDQATRLLLESGSEKDAVDRAEGWTPLHHAVENHHLSVVKTLLAYGANTKIQDNEGDTALRVAIMRVAPNDIVNVLMNA